MPADDLLHEQMRELLGCLLRLGISRRRERVALAAPPARGLADAKISARHVTAVVQLSLHGPLSVGQLAERLEVTYATASLLATDIEDAGLLERRRDATDGRRVLLTVDPHVGEHVLERRIAPMRRTLERLDAGERAAFVKAMALFAAELERVDPAPP